MYTVFQFILLSMFSTLVGIIGLFSIIACVILIYDLFMMLGDRMNSAIKHKQTYQGNEETNE